MIYLIFILILTIVIISKVLSEDKDRTKKIKKEFINLPDNEKEIRLIEKVESDLYTYLKCLAVGNYNKMKYICSPEYFKTLKVEEKERKRIDGSVQINKDYNIIESGITDYREYNEYEYSRYSITYRNLINKSEEEKKGYCSNCGAPLEIKDNRCAYCDKFIGDTYSEYLITNINKSY